MRKKINSWIPEMKKFCFMYGNLPAITVESFLNIISTLYRVQQNFQ